MPAEAKVAFVEALAAAGLPVVEVTSFVSPRAVPQLADADEVFPRVRRVPGVRYPVLVPNMRGMERAERAGADAVAVFTAASEAFNERNIGMTIAESLRGLRAGARAGDGARVVAPRLRLDGVRMSVLGSRRPGARRRGLRGAGRARLRRDLGRRHDRRRRARRRPRRVRRAARRDCRSSDWPCTCTTRAAGRSTTCGRGSSAASRSTTRRPAALAGARSPPARPATWRPSRCARCWTDWASSTASTPTAWPRRPSRCGRTMTAAPRPAVG